MLCQTKDWPRRLLSCIIRFVLVSLQGRLVLNLGQVGLMEALYFQGVLGRLVSEIVEESCLARLRD